MKKLLPTVFLLLSWIALDVRAQSPGELVIPSFDDVQQSVYFCGDISQNSVKIEYGLANAFSSVDPHFVVDSVVESGDPQTFIGLQTIREFPLGGVALFPGPRYEPRKVGSDTLTISGYYGSYVTIAKIVCHAVPSPPIALYGYTVSLIDIGGGNALLPLNAQLRSDTLHDVMNQGQWYFVSTVPKSPGDNPYVEIRACAETIIDSMTMIGDFSDFSFFDTPQFPVQMHSGDSLLLRYLFTPADSGNHNPLLVFHVRGGASLVWSFEYRVTIKAAVDVEPALDPGSLDLFPNPSNRSMTISLASGLPPARLAIFNELGTKLLEIERPTAAIGKREKQDYRLNTSALPAGWYVLRLSTESGGALSRRFIIQH